jgi:large subunit ribosomal protein L4
MGAISLNLYSRAGDPAGTVGFAEELLLLDRGDQAVKDVVVAMRAARRAGTASTRGKGEVAGSNRKPWRQKGTGRARAGLRRSPLWRGGGVAMGPRPRDFDLKVNRKVARLAWRRALSARIAAGRLLVVESFAAGNGRTSEIAAQLRRLGLQRGALLVPAGPDAMLARAARNLPRTGVAPATQVDVYLLLAHRAVVTTREGLEVLAARMRGTEAAA